MKKYVLRLFLVSIPSILLFVFSFILAGYIGEGLMYPSYRELKRSGKIYGSKFDDNTYRAYKLEAIEENPTSDVLAIGSSRVLQFRAEMFDDSFFNVGYMIERISDIEIFLKKLPKNRLPKTIIMGLDQWMFNKNYDSLEYNPDWGRFDYSKISFVRYLSFIRSILKREITLRQLAGFNYSRYKGLNALENNVGIRYDGSFHYGKQLDMLLAGSDKVSDYNYSETLGRIRDGVLRFQPGDEINPLAGKHIQNMIKFADDNGIHLIILVPPLPDIVVETMRSSSRYGYFDKIGPYIQSFLKGSSHELHIFHTASSVGSDDSEVVDGFHCGESTYIKTLIKMVENGSAISKHLDVGRLRSDLLNRINRYLVYK